MAVQPKHSQSREIGDVLSIGFGTSVLMWGVGYLCRLPGAPVPSAVVFLLLIVCMIAGGYAAGRWSRRGKTAGLWSGLVTGSINLLVLGSLLGGKEAGELATYAALWVPGSILLAMACALCGARIARRGLAAPPVEPHWPMIFAVVAATATLLLLPIGGNVTGYDAGMAVPDWPGSFGYNMFLFPLTRMTGGVYFEHAHRLMGALVGLTTLTLTIYLQFADRRLWLRAMAWLTLAAVIAQGLMGGFRVTETSRALAIVHGVFAQVFFAGLVALAAVLSPAWTRISKRENRASASLDFKLGAIAVLCVLAQITLGAALRHFGWGVTVHVSFAIVAALAAGAFAFRCWGLYESTPIVSRFGSATLGVLSLQILLGFGALAAILTTEPGQVPGRLHVLVTTAHQTTGALLLATTCCLLLWMRRMFAPAPTTQAAIAGSTARTMTDARTSNSSDFVREEQERSSVR